MNRNYHAVHVHYIDAFNRDLNGWKLVSKVIFRRGNTVYLLSNIARGLPSAVIMIDSHGISNKR